MFIYAVPTVLIGTVCIYIGRHWDTLKTNTKSSIVSAIDYLSESYVVLFLIFVLFLGGTAISPILLWPPSHNIAQVETQAFSTGPITTLIGVALLLFIGAVIGVTQSRRLQAPTSRKLSADSDVLDIHTCRIEVYEDKLPSELYIESYVTVYNSEDFNISINAVSGTISIGNMPETVLSSPMIIGGSLEATSKSESAFILRQHMPSDAATAFHHAISNGDTMVCGLRSLIISIVRSDKPGIACPLQLWDEIRLAKSIVAKGSNLVALSARG